MSYVLIDSGNQKKIERFGKYSIIRPCNQALWSCNQKSWDEVDASFSREENVGWEGDLPKEWIIEHDGLKFKIAPTDFGHLGIFPEHSFLWAWASGLIKKDSKVLNLFAYSGGATLAFARAGAEVCHIDASQGMIKWARENVALNGLGEKPIRWIVDDVMKFLRREIRRGRKYDGILMDPPSFGRGAKGEVFKIERDIRELLSLCKQLLSDTPQFFACSNHTNSFTPLVMQHLLEEIFPSNVESGELVLKSATGRDLPTGTYARWRP